MTEDMLIDCERIKPPRAVRIRIIFEEAARREIYYTTAAEDCDSGAEKLESCAIFWRKIANKMVDEICRIANKTEDVK